MSELSISRRDVLAVVGAGVVGSGNATGVESGTPDELESMTDSDSVALRRALDSDSTVARYAIGTDSRAASRAARSRAEVVNHALDFAEFGRAVTGAFSAEAVAALRDRDDVRYAEESTTFDLLSDGASGTEAEQTLPWGVDRIDADAAHAADERGDGAHVAVIDSGVRANHPDLRPNLGDGKAFVDCWADVSPTCRANPKTGKVECWLQVRKCPTDWGDDAPAGHGTHVAGTVAATDDGRGVVGVAPAATLHSVKVINAGGVARDADIAAAIEYVADRGWDVANLSLGNLASSRVVADACRYAFDRGVLLVAAVGNAGPRQRTVAFPARLPTVVAVSATTRTDRVAPFSSRGANVDLAAPGTDVCSTVRTGQGVQSGTSMAAPHVSGVGALLMARGHTNVEARERVRETAEDLGAASGLQGDGLVDAAAALGLDTGDDGTGRGVCHPPNPRGE